jgi:hypothetical protein
MRKPTSILLFMLAVALVPACAQSTCSAPLIRGTYSVTCTGWISPAAGAPQVPASVMVTIKNDWAGNVTGSGKMSMGGAILDQTVTGLATVNSDCTGTVSYDQKIGGQPAPKLNILFHVLDEGKDMRGMSVDPGATLMCNLRLMSR